MTISYSLKSNYNIYKQYLKSSPSELVYGQNIRMPGELVQVTNEIVEINDTPKRLKNHLTHVRSTNLHHNKTNSEDLFCCCSWSVQFCFTFSIKKI